MTKTQKKKSAPHAAKRPQPAPTFSREYKEYLKRFSAHGEERSKLSPKEFEELDDEYLDLLDQETANGWLDDDQSVRKQELEFLLLENEE